MPVLARPLGPAGRRSVGMFGAVMEAGAKVLEVNSRGAAALESVRGWVFSVGHRNAHDVEVANVYEHVRATELGKNARDEVNRLSPVHR